MMLQFQNVRCAASDAYDGGLDGVDVALDAGDLLLLRVPAGHHRTPLPDLAQGLVNPEEGSVTFSGHDWRGLSPGRAAALRGRIGRVFDAGGWLSNLDVDENITLSQRYHTTRAEADIQDEARRLAREFGLADLPTGRPHAVDRSTLRCAQWVRAFLGQPALLVCDHAAHELEAPWTAALLAQLRAARAGGAAVIWLTSNAADARHPGLNPTLIFELKETRMCPWRSLSNSGT
ncbi:MAG: organic solvent ABC transporter ATP-binding protein [Lentisphaerae bacterium]|nr:organic solvent ABC transporter ATP-binding protein [Lentisphaerota bacterium]